MENILGWFGVGLMVWVFTYGLNRIWLTFKRFVN